MHVVELEQIAQFKGQAAQTDIPFQMKPDLQEVHKVA